MVTTWFVGMASGAALAVGPVLAGVWIVGGGLFTLALVLWSVVEGASRAFTSRNPQQVRKFFKDLASALGWLMGGALLLGGWWRLTGVI